MMKIVTTDVFGKQYEVEPDGVKLSIHVYGITVRDDGKVLISPQFDGYDWPGGTAKIGEDTVTTLKREFREETGYDVEPVKVLGIYTSFFHHIKRNEDYQALLIFYAVKVVGGKITTVGFDVDEREYAKEARWASIDELRHERLACNLDIANELLDLAEGLICS